jgi:CBS domain-containing protein
MNAVSERTHSESLVLDAATAADLMGPDMVSIRADATVAEAVELLIAKGFSAAPVIDEAGRAVGVLSRSDLLIHDRERTRGTAADGLSGEDKGVCVCDLMTPVVFSVPPDAPAYRVIADMLALKVHRLFVSDSGGVLLGVISALDVLQHLRPPSSRNGS